MKRSEMIEYLRGEVFEIINDYYVKNERDHGFLNRKATGILDLIEGLGMRPPVDGSFLYITMRDWEQEDDKGKTNNHQDG